MYYRLKLLFCVSAEKRGGLAAELPVAAVTSGGLLKMASALFTLKGPAPGDCVVSN